MSVTQHEPSIDNVTWARKVLATGEIADLEEALVRIRGLKAENRFDLAGRVLALTGLASTHPRYAYVHQQIANCTYKDEDIPMPHRFYVALGILRDKCNLDATTDPETLGLGGAVFKRLWDYGGQREHLERSLALYHKAHQQQPQDEGWVAINTAFVYDLLAAQESTTVDGIAPDAPSQRFKEAESIRTKLFQELTAAPPEQPSWWYCATVAEAALGIGNAAAATAWLQKGLAAGPSQWERDSTARQLAVLARVQSDRRRDPLFTTAAEQTLEQGLGLTPQAVRSVLLGKVGLALSGGGMRAALFHIGMLAKLAELDVLRHVEVLSCVSGGSIIGAFFYLELKKLLEAKASLDQADYIRIVQTVEREFLAGVQTNIRTRLGSSIPASFMMATFPGYSRSTRAGDLYEKMLYKRVDGIGKRELRQLTIKPAGTSAFNPKYDNWNRDSKVPILVLNATAINTGHNWQFTATWMGESPQAINGAVDAIPRLRRMYIDGRDEIPDRFRKVRLGHAVAASAGVPGLFEPIVMRKLYPDRTVRLVDGGVHDNQGLASLIEQSCSIMLVSDASGQMSEVQNPPGGVVSVASRTNGILQARVREAQFNELQTLRRSGALDGAMFIHLTKDLEAGSIPFEGANDAHDAAKQQQPETTTYGVDRRVQEQLAAVRTDLDSFSDAEAYALMMSAYLMTERAFLEEGCVPTLPVNRTTANWEFLSVRDAVAQPGSEDNVRLRRLLKVSSKLALKVWSQSPVLSGAAIAAGLALLAAGGFALAEQWTQVPRWPQWIAKAGEFLRTATFGDYTLGAVAIALLIGARFALDKWLHFQKRFGEFVLGVSLMTVGFVASWLHLTVFDQIFLWYGHWPRKSSAAPPAFAQPGSPRLSIRTQAPQPPPAPSRVRVPLVRRILNLFPPPR